MDMSAVLVGAQFFFCSPRGISSAPELSEPVLRPRTASRAMSYCENNNNDDNKVWPGPPLLPDMGVQKKSFVEDTPHGVDNISIRYA